MRQFAWFDCIRCVAIFMVMLMHGGLFYTMLPSTPAAWIATLQRISWSGVDLFFVLSGFLVSGLLFGEHDKTGTIDIKRFLVRRAFKIIPAYYVLVVVTIIYQAVAFRHVDWEHALHDVLFLQSYRLGLWPHPWTLALEVHFYILLGLLLYYLYRRQRGAAEWLRPLPFIICGVLVACFFTRWINSGVRMGNFNMHNQFWPTHLHLDVLAAGVLLRYLYTYHLDALGFLQRRRLWWIVLGLALVFPSQYILLPQHPAVVTALVPTCNYLGFGLILFQATQLPYPATGWASWLVKPFDYLGKHSYSIYLWHLPVREWIVNPLVPDKASWLYFLFFFGASLAVGTLLSEVLEMPVLKLRNRLFPSTLSGRTRDEAGASAAVTA